MEMGISPYVRFQFNPLIEYLFHVNSTAVQPRSCNSQASFRIKYVAYYKRGHGVAIFRTFLYRIKNLSNDYSIFTSSCSCRDLYSFTVELISHLELKEFV